MAKHWAMGKGTDIYEQRRYEIARDVMAALLTTTHYSGPYDLESAASDSVDAADALLKALENSNAD